MLGVSGKGSSRRQAFSEAASVPGTASGPNFGALPVEVGRAGGPRAAGKGLGVFLTSCSPQGLRLDAFFPQNGVPAGPPCCPVSYSEPVFV